MCVKAKTQQISRGQSVCKQQKSNMQLCSGSTFQQQEATGSEVTVSSAERHASSPPPAAPAAARSIQSA